MSRPPSPVAQTLSIPPLSAHSARQKSKTVPMGITAGAEDVKYQAKYKELKRKVKEIEQDNEKLHFRVLQAKRNIQRMKVERAILYERLSGFPSSPDLNDRQSLPPLNPVSSAVSPSGHHEPSYGRTKMSTGPDGRPPVPVMDAPAGVMPLHNPRNSSGGSDARQLPPLPGSLPPIQAMDGPQSPLSRTHHDSPSMHHERTSSRSHSSSRSRVHQQPFPPQQAYHHAPPHSQQQYDSLPPIQHHSMHSPSLSERERERRRQDIHDMDSSRVQPPLSPDALRSTSSTRDRIHNHQRLGPGTYINREEQAVRDRDYRDYDREQEWELERERDIGFRDSSSRSTAIPQPSHHHSHSPPAVHRSIRQQHSRMRDEQPYYHEVPASGGGKGSRSDTSGSGASGHGPSPDSPRGAGYSSYEHDRQSRPYKLQPVEPMDYAHPDDISPRDRNGSGGPGGSAMYSHADSGRKGKRTGGTMEVDSSVSYHPEDSPTSAYPPQHQDRERGMGRYHRRGSESLEDVRMGP